MIRIRDLTTNDFDAVVAINQVSQPFVFEIDAAEFSLLLGLCEYSKVLEIDGEIAGYVFALGKGEDYNGEEYHWFCQQVSDDFLYIDQVALAPEWRGHGCGTRYTMIWNITRLDTKRPAWSAKYTANLSMTYRCVFTTHWDSRKSRESAFGILKYRYS